MILQSQHHTYWLQSAGPVEMSGVGLESVEHPVLGAVIEVPESDGLVISGRISLFTHPWLADHMVSGVVMVPGTALVEWAIQAGDRVGCPVVEELVLQSPVLLSGSDVSRIQVRVGEVDQSGRRTIGIHSRPEGADPSWTRHATGYLIPDTPVSDAALDAGSGWAGVWPPAGAHPVGARELYDALAERGYDYGPAFQGLTAGWVRGRELFGEAVLPEQADASGFAIHPALFDAALHTALLAPDTTVDGAGATDDTGVGVVAPFAWNRIVLHASGAKMVRVRVVAGADGVSVDLADPSGTPVLSVDSMVSRPIPLEQLTPERDGRRDALFGINWTRLPQPRAERVPVTVISSAPELATVTGMATGFAEWLVLRPDAGPTHLPDPERARVVVNRVLKVVQAFLTEPVWEASRLVIATQSGVALDQGESVDPVACAVWGLVRTAQAENPDQILLADLDTQPDAVADVVSGVLGGVVAAGEGQCAVRGGAVWVPRLVQVEQDIVARDGGGRVLDPAGTVLITDETGALGALVARHVVSVHGVRSVVLASRRGVDASKAVGLREELQGWGARVEVVACDTADREQVRALLGRVPVDTPLTGVVHTADVLDEGVITALTPERVDEVFRSKVDAAVWLDELTRELDPAVFVVFSSVAGVLGTAGQGNYAAANAFLDGLAFRRRAAGPAAVSLAWGYWAPTSGMTGQLGQADTARMTRSGMRALEPAQGMQLMDAGLVSARAVVVPTILDLAVLRDQARVGVLPAMLQGVVGRIRRVAQTTPTSTGLLAQLAGLDTAGQVAVLTDLVRSEAATVLGRTTSEQIAESQAFKDAGFTSLTAMELRNRLAGLTQLKLPATLVFDHPTPAAVAGYLRMKMVPDAPEPLVPGLAELDSLEEALSATSPDEETRRVIAARLRGLLGQLTQESDAGNEETVAEKLESITVDELFDFIDKQL